MRIDWFLFAAGARERERTGVKVVCAELPNPEKMFGFDNGRGEGRIFEFDVP